MSYKENFVIIGEYNQVRNLDWGTPTEDYMYQIAVNDKIDKNENYIFGSLFHQLSSKYYNLSGGGHSIILVRDHRYDRFDLKSNWIAINPALATHLKWVPEPTRLFGWKNLQGELMAESIYWADGNIQMPSRQDGEVGEGWFVIVSKVGLEQFNLIETNLFLQKKTLRTKCEDSEIKRNQIYNITKL